MGCIWSMGSLWTPDFHEIRYYSINLHYRVLKNPFLKWQMHTLLLILFYSIVPIYFFSNVSFYIYTPFKFSTYSFPSANGTLVNQALYYVRSEMNDVCPPVSQSHARSALEWPICDMCGLANFLRLCINQCSFVVFHKLSQS